MAATNRKLDELLLLRATQAMTEAQRAELDELLATLGAVDVEAYERAAAAVHVGALPTRAEMPPALRARIEQQALRYLRARRRSDSKEKPEP